MSNGIASGVPPADGGAGGVAGAGACAKVDELMTAMAHAARVIETIGRMGFSDLSFTFVKFAFVSHEHDPEKWKPVFPKRSCSNKEMRSRRSRSHRRRQPVLAVGDARGLQRSV